MSESGNDLYVWQVLEDGVWGQIGAVLPNVGIANLVTRDKVAVEMMRDLAQAHAERTGLPIRLAKFHCAEVLERYD